MTKEEYNKNRPKIECPICKKLITKANFNRHFTFCNSANEPNNNGFKNKDDGKFHLDHNDLFCKFCKKECKNKNSLVQHELRCRENPNRKDYEFKGNPSPTREDIIARNKKSAQTLREKYKNGYVSPLTGRKIVVNYIYEDHNNSEIQKWLDYINSKEIILPEYSTRKLGNEGYTYLSVKNNELGSKYITEHALIAALYADIDDITKHTVHHIDRDRANNEKTNLMVFETNNEHKRFHTSKYAYLTYNEDTHIFNCELKK